MQKKQLWIYGIIFLIMILPTINAINFSSPNGLYQGSLEIGTIGGVEGSNGLYETNVTLGETIAGVFFSGGLYNGSLGFAPTFDITPPVISQPFISKATAIEQETIDFYANCTDDKYAINLVNMEIQHENGTLYNQTATLNNGIQYKTSLVVNRGVYTFISVYCRNSKGLFTTSKFNQTVNVAKADSSGGYSPSNPSPSLLLPETVVPSEIPPENQSVVASIGGSIGGAVSAIFNSLTQERIKAEPIQSIVGNWTVATSDEYIQYISIILSRDDKTDYEQYPVIVKNIGTSTLLFTASCKPLNSSDLYVKDPCSLVNIRDDNFTLLAGQLKVVGVKIQTPHLIKDGSELNFDVVLKDNGDFEQGVSYNVYISYLLGMFLKIILALIVAIFTMIVTYLYSKKKGYSTVMTVTLTIGTSIIMGSLTFIIQNRLF